MQNNKERKGAHRATYRGLHSFSEKNRDLCIANQYSQTLLQYLIFKTH